MKFKCLWHLQIGKHIMLSIHNHFDNPHFLKVPSYGDIMFGVGGFEFHYHKFPIGETLWI